MNDPTVENVLNDRERDVRYVFLAFRVMTREEKVDAYRVAQAGKRPPARGSVLYINTSIGIND